MPHHREPFIWEGLKETPSCPRYPPSLYSSYWFWFQPGDTVTPITRERVLDVIKSLPAETSVEEAMERLYFLADIEEGLRQVEQGQVVSHEEAKGRLLGRR